MKKESPREEISRRNTLAGHQILAAIWGEPRASDLDNHAGEMGNYCRVERDKWLRGEVGDSEKLAVANVHISASPTLPAIFLQGGENTPAQPVWSGQITIDAEMTKSGDEAVIGVYAHRNDHMLIRCAGCDSLHAIAYSRAGYCTQHCLNREIEHDVETGGDCKHCGGNGKHRSPSLEQGENKQMFPCLFCNGKGRDANLLAKDGYPGVYDAI